MTLPKYVYTLTNRHNGKIYVGCSQCPGIRFAKHKYDMRSGKHTNKPMQRDYDEYGDCFDIRVVSGPWSDADGFRQERELKTLLKTYDERYGYNSTEHSMNAERRKSGLSYWESPCRGRHLVRGTDDCTGDSIRITVSQGEAK